MLIILQGPSFSGLPTDVTPEHCLCEVMSFRDVRGTNKSKDTLKDAKLMQMPAQTSRHATKAMEQQTPTGSSDILNRACCELLQ